VESDPGEAGAAEVTPGAVELSNTDVGQSLVDLQQASIQFRANLETLRITDRLFEELLSMRRTG
jgi:flagellar hook protein FlgE